jgi:hypothetical protein
MKQVFNLPIEKVKIDNTKSTNFSGGTQPVREVENNTARSISNYLGHGGTTDSGELPSHRQADANSKARFIIGHDGMNTGTGKFTEMTGSDADKAIEAVEKIGSIAIVENSYRPKAFETIARGNQVSAPLIINHSKVNSFGEQPSYFSQGSISGLNRPQML